MKNIYFVEVQKYNTIQIDSSVDRKICLTFFSVAAEIADYYI